MPTLNDILVILLLAAFGTAAGYAYLMWGLA